MLVAVTEMNQKDEIDALVMALKELSPKPAVKKIAKTKGNVKGTKKTARTRRAR
jgi:hypothetical protein